MLHQIFCHGSWPHKIISPLPSLSLYWSTATIAAWPFNGIVIPWARFFVMVFFVLCQHTQLLKSRITQRKGDVVVFSICGCGLGPCMWEAPISPFSFPPSLAPEHGTLHTGREKCGGDKTHLLHRSLVQNSCDFKETVRLLTQGKSHF